LHVSNDIIILFPFNVTVMHNVSVTTNDNILYLNKCVGQSHFDSEISVNAYFPFNIGMSLDKFALFGNQLRIE